jgi:hypothetical protein
MKAKAHHLLILANVAAKGSGTKGKDVTSSHGEHGYTFVP